MEKSTTRNKLYKKRSGECFLVIETKRSCFGSSWNEKRPEIITFTEEETMKFAEDNIPVEEYERVFGPVTE